MTNINNKFSLPPAISKFIEDNYLFDISKGIWNCKKEKQFPYSDGAEIENAILSIINKSTDRSSSSLELHRSASDWPTNYHLNMLRANLFRPIQNFLKGMILEIGAGCGAITRFLGETGANIVAVEGSNRRASIAASRCVDLPNVSIISDDFSTFPHGLQFDVVTLIGVLEYARCLFKGGSGDPVDELIARARSFLRPGGVLIVAIENQLGLKYFAGCPEDHIGCAMAGIEDRYGNNTPVCFGRAELSRRLSTGGLPEQQWWFPSPDYKLPVSLLSDKILEHNVDFSDIFSQSSHTDMQISRPLAFSLDHAWRPVFRNGLWADMANSFLVLSSDQPLPQHDVLAEHYGGPRRPEFRKVVRFEWQDGHIIVRRSFLNAAKSRTVEKIISMHLTDELFVAGRNFFTELTDLMNKTGWTLSEWKMWAKKWFEVFLKHAQIPQIPAKDYIVSGELFDAIPRNLMFDNENNPIFIDQEWTYEKPLEVGYVVFRAIYDSLLNVVNCKPPVEGVSLRRDMLFRSFTSSLGWDISEEDFNRFIEAEAVTQEAVSSIKIQSKKVFYEQIPLRLNLEDLLVQTDGLQRDILHYQDTIQSLQRNILHYQDTIQRGTHLKRYIKQAVKHIKEYKELTTQILATKRMTKPGAILSLPWILRAMSCKLFRSNLGRNIKNYLLVRSSPLFESAWYLNNNEDVASSGIDPVLHYVLYGGFEGRQPSRFFNASVYLDNNKDLVGTNINPLCHYLLYGLKEGRTLGDDNILRGLTEASKFLDSKHDGLLCNDSHFVDSIFDDSHKLCLNKISKFQDVFSEIASSNLFDETTYAGTAEAKKMCISPIAHYACIGEELGLSPSNLFDPAFYKASYPDVNDYDPCVLAHYVRYGKSEGRAPRSIADQVRYPVFDSNPDKRNVIVVVHEASRTGAPILGWNLIQSLKRMYNVIALVMRKGALQHAIECAANTTVVLPQSFVHCEFECNAVATNLFLRYSPEYVIANSLETRQFVSSFANHGIPVIMLVHEFSSTYQPVESLFQSFEFASHVVFPAHLVAESALKDTRGYFPRRYSIFPQGKSETPPVDVNTINTIEPYYPLLDSKNIPKIDDNKIFPPHDGTLFVVGIGVITSRKGVDIFIAMAAELVRRRPDLKIDFAWVGEAYQFDQSYFDSIELQVVRCGLSGRFRFLGSFSNLNTLYDRIDILALTSRLDPFPNVAIDCLLRGIPILCFENASGIAEFFLKSETTASLVVPYLDADSMAARLVEIADNADLLAKLSRAVKACSYSVFDMNSYVDKIDTIAQYYIKKIAQTSYDFDVIDASGIFNATLYQEVVNIQVDSKAALRHYLLASIRATPRSKPLSGYFVRRPVEGFNPLIYALDNDTYDESTGEDPLAHFIRHGLPSGRWKHNVITPVDTICRNIQNIKVAIHGHFYYIDLFHEFLDRIKLNSVLPDLFITTNSTKDKKIAERTLSTFGMHDSHVTVVPNKGRDIGPFFSAFPPDIFMAYDVIGHLHGKRTTHADILLGDIWRTFMWEHLIGGDYPMLDIVASSFASNPRLGLVFPEDPNLCDWTDNLSIATVIAKKMGIVSLPTHFDFPIGTMFWARPSALVPMFNLNLTWEDYPAEPIPIDGTLLHALERLVPFSVEKAGYEYATTYVRNHRR